MRQLPTTGILPPSRDRTPDEARTAGAYYQSFDFLDCFVDFAAWFASLKLALQFNEGLIGTVEPPRQDRCNVKEGDRVFPEQGGRIRDGPPGVRAAPRTATLPLL
jgi:hypothetical protein